MFLPKGDKSILNGIGTPISVIAATCCKSVYIVCHGVDGFIVFCLCQGFNFFDFFTIISFEGVKIIQVGKKILVLHFL